MTLDIRYPSCLSDADRAALHELANWPALRHLLIYAGLIILLAGAVAFAMPGWPLAMILLGILLAFLFNLCHECTHKTAFRSVWLNNSVGWLIGLILFQPFHWFRYFHLAHHRHVNDPEHDPELLGHRKPESWSALAGFVLCHLYWQSKASLLLTHAFGTVAGDYLPNKVHTQLRFEARAYLAIYSLLLIASVLVSPLLLWIWIIPLMLGFPFLRLFHLAEHGLCPTVRDKFSNTRTVLTHRIARFVTWNMPFHIEHHLMPGVPFHRLPVLHELICAEPGNVCDGYITFLRRYCRVFQKPG